MTAVSYRCLYPQTCMASCTALCTAYAILLCCVIVYNLFFALQHFVFVFSTQCFVKLVTNPISFLMLWFSYLLTRYRRSENFSCKNIFVVCSTCMASCTAYAVFCAVLLYTNYYSLPSKIFYLFGFSAQYFIVVKHVV